MYSLSLLNKFKGGLIGALIGETLSQNQPLHCLALEQVSPAVKIAIASAISTVEHRGIDFNSWLIGAGKIDAKCLSQKGNLNLSETLIATLPVALFCHENLPKLQDYLRRSLKLWQHPDLPCHQALLWGKLIGVILQTQPDSGSLASQIIAMLREHQVDNFPVAGEISNCIEGRVSLKEVSDYLARHGGGNLGASMQGIYCFATVEDNFWLGLRRALSSSYQPRLSATLAGILLGLNNGYTNIPLHWRSQLKQSSLGRQLEELSERLFAVWSGSYSFNSRLNF